MSKESEILLGLNSEGQSIIKTLYKNLDSQKIEEITSLIQSISKIKKEDWENFIENFPGQISYIDQNEKKLTLDIVYNPIWEDNGSILKIQIILNVKS